MTVTVADGRKLECNSKCSNFVWEVDNCKFTAGVRLLPLGGCDMVIGIDFLSKLGPILVVVVKRILEGQQSNQISRY